MEAPKPANISGMILIGKSFVIKGQISCEGDLYIDGQIEGSVDPKGNRLTIGPEGRLKANVNARSVVVQGKLEGNIQATERVDLKQSAVVVGDIVTQSISIDPGAEIKGKIEVHGGVSRDKAASAVASATNDLGATVAPEPALNMGRPHKAVSPTGQSR